MRPALSDTALSSSARRLSGDLLSQLSEAGQWAPQVVVPLFASLNGLLRAIADIIVGVIDIVAFLLYGLSIEVVRVTSEAQLFFPSPMTIPGLTAAQRSLVVVYIVGVGVVLAIGHISGMQFPFDSNLSSRRLFNRAAQGFLAVLAGPYLIHFAVEVVNTVGRPLVGKGYALAVLSQDIPDVVANISGILGFPLVLIFLAIPALFARILFGLALFFREYLVYTIYVVWPVVMLLWVFDRGPGKYGAFAAKITLKYLGISLVLGIIIAGLMGVGGAVATDGLSTEIGPGTDPGNITTTGTPAGSAPNTGTSTGATDAANGRDAQINRANNESAAADRGTPPVFHSSPNWTVVRGRLLNGTNATAGPGITRTNESVRGVSGTNAPVGSGYSKRLYVRSVGTPVMEAVYKYLFAIGTWTLVGVITLLSYGLFLSVQTPTTATRLKRGLHKAAAARRPTPSVTNFNVVPGSQIEVATTADGGRVLKWPGDAGGVVVDSDGGVSQFTDPGEFDFTSGWQAVEVGPDGQLHPVERGTQYQPDRVGLGTKLKNAGRRVRAAATDRSDDLPSGDGASSDQGSEDSSIRKTLLEAVEENVDTLSEAGEQRLSEDTVETIDEGLSEDLADGVKAAKEQSEAATESVRQGVSLVKIATTVGAKALVQADPYETYKKADRELGRIYGGPDADQFDTRLATDEDGVPLVSQVATQGGDLIPTGNDLVDEDWRRQLREDLGVEDTVSPRPSDLDLDTMGESPAETTTVDPTGTAGSAESPLDEAETGTQVATGLGQDRPGDRHATRYDILNPEEWAAVGGRKPPGNGDSGDPTGGSGDPPSGDSPGDGAGDAADGDAKQQEASGDIEDSDPTAQKDDDTDWERVRKEATRLKEGADPERANSDISEGYADASPSESSSLETDDPDNVDDDQGLWDELLEEVDDRTDTEDGPDTSTEESEASEERDLTIESIERSPAFRQPTVGFENADDISPPDSQETGTSSTSESTASHAGSGHDDTENATATESDGQHHIEEPSWRPMGANPDTLDQPETGDTHPQKPARLNSADTVPEEASRSATLDEDAGDIDQHRRDEPGRPATQSMLERVNPTPDNAYYDDEEAVVVEDVLSKPDVREEFDIDEDRQVTPKVKVNVFDVEGRDPSTTSLTTGDDPETRFVPPRVFAAMRSSKHIGIKTDAGNIVPDEPE